MTDEDESEPYQTDGHITVTRSIDNGTSMHEVWELESIWWCKDAIERESSPTVHCYVTAEREVTGVPHTDHSVSDSINFAEAPEEVRRAFIKQMGRISSLNYAIDPNTDDD